MSLAPFLQRAARGAGTIPPFFCVGTLHYVLSFQSGRRPRRAAGGRETTDKEKTHKRIKYGTINKKNPPNRSVGEIIEIIPTTHDRTIPGSESV